MGFSEKAICCCSRQKNSNMIADRGGGSLTHSGSPSRSCFSRWGCCGLPVIVFVSALQHAHLNIKKGAANGEPEGVCRVGGLSHRALCAPECSDCGIGRVTVRRSCMGGWAVLLDFHLAPPWAAFPPVLANDASLMLHGSAEQSDESGDGGIAWVKIKTR